jgi:hypothetical protein
MSHFVPGNAGVKSNERANTLAGVAVVQDCVAIGRTGILNVLRDNWRAS